jgi:rhodanese-related sulfurtransferase
MYKEITHNELEVLIKNKSPIELIDVREKDEHDMIRIPQAKLIPLSQFANRIHEIDWIRPVYIFCRTGGRS